MSSQQCRLRIVRFICIDRDHTVGVTGEHRFAVRIVALCFELEGEAVLGILAFRRHRQLEPDQAVDQSTLGSLELEPLRLVQRL